MLLLAVQLMDDRGVSCAKTLSSYGTRYSLVKLALIVVDQKRGRNSLRLLVSYPSGRQISAAINPKVNI